MFWPGLTSFAQVSTTQSRKRDRLIALSNAGGIFLVCGILFGGEALAAPPNPPVFIGDNVVLVGENNSNRINAILDGYTVPSILLGLQYPADPVTTAMHEVRNNSELASAVGGNGRLIRIYGPGNGGQSTYNQFDLGGRSDIDIVMDNDATITGAASWAWWGAVRRIRWTGGNIHINSGSGDGFRINDSEDVLFDDVRMYKSISNGHIFYPGLDRNLRFAMINSTIEFTASGEGVYYAVFSAGDPASRGDWVFLNNRFIGEGPPVRLMSLGLRTAIVANYFSEFPNPASIRVHEETDKFWFAHNVSVHGGGNQYNLSFVVSGGSFNVSTVMNDFLIEDNRLFARQSLIDSGHVMRLGDIVPENRSQATNWVIRRNTWSDPAGPIGGEPHGWFLIDVAYTAENNLRVGPGHPSYEIPPAASGFGAIR